MVISWIEDYLDVLSWSEDMEVRNLFADKFSTEACLRKWNHTSLKISKGP